MVNEKLLLVIHLEPGQVFTDELKAEISVRNSHLTNYKRVHGLVLYHEDFPLTASLKIKRSELAQHLGKLDREPSILPI
jgi:acyl-coenzyme A synthetase/AMP-(fatty) acid ligase